jgi:glycosyltransferase involved in cell wall biosynthesis
VVGDGPLRDALQQQIERCGLPAGRVSLLGRSHSPWQLMREADAFVLASAYEGFPNALLEAVAIGLPSISTDCRSGPREISDEGRVVRLVPTDDLAALAGALDKLLGDPSLRRRLSETGPGSVRRRFSLPTVLARWDELFAAVTGSKRQQPPVPPHMRDSEADQ